MAFLGTGVNYAARDQGIAVHEPGVEHALQIQIAHGIVALRVGTSPGDNAYLDAILTEGWHSLAFTPSGDFWIRLGANTEWPSTVGSIQLEPAGVVEVPTSWGAGDLSNLFYDQSEDVLFVACLGVPQQRIERRSQRSWSVVRYYADDGPYRLPNTSALLLAPGGPTGNVSLSASRPFFQPGHFGALFKLTQQGQFITAILAGESQSTAAIRVSGLRPQRDIAIIINGAFVETIWLQRSIGVVGSWYDVKSYTAGASESYNDQLDNQVIFYRLFVKPGGWVSGSADVQLISAGSIQTGVGRVTQIVSPTVAQIDVLQHFTGAAATSDWTEGDWSPYRGFPAAVALHDGRLFFGHDTAIQGSVSDAYASYDPAFIGDAGPINRTIATGGRDGVRWLLSSQRLLAGTAQQEVSIRSDAFDAPLTPTAFVARDCSTRGAARVRALKIDAIAAFVGRDGKRVFKLVFEGQFGDYRAHELTRLKQEMCAAGIVDCAVQRNPDTRLWYVLADGTVAVLTYDEEEDIAAWTPFATLGHVERVAVLPGTDEDEVYFVVARTVGGVTRRFVELLAERTQCQAGTLNRTSDCHLVYTGAPTNTIAVPHLTGQQVVVWADGAARVRATAPITVDGGGIATIPGAPVSNAVIGLAYTGIIKTSKLAYGAERGTALTMPKRVARVGLVMANVPWQGLKLGRATDRLLSLPATYRGRPLADGEVVIDYDDVPGPFNGGWNPDSRVCLAISSPDSVTVMGLVVDMETNEPNAPVPQQGQRGPSAER
jgi:hypothetical protein